MQTQTVEVVPPSRPSITPISPFPIPGISSSNSHISPFLYLFISSAPKPNQNLLRKMRVFLLAREDPIVVRLIEEHPPLLYGSREERERAEEGQDNNGTPREVTAATVHFILGGSFAFGLKKEKNGEGKDEKFMGIEISCRDSDGHILPSANG